MRKKLIEVALPLDAINRESAREKSIRHGHPSTLHLWWARRPLAACRAVLFSSLVDDPSSDPAYRRADGTVKEEQAGVKRAQLFKLIEELVKWENSNNETIINAARAEIARCVASRKVELGELRKDTVIWPTTDRHEGTEARRHEGAENPKFKIQNPKSAEPVTVADLLTKGHAFLDDIRAGRWRLPNPAAVNAFLAEHAPPVLDPFCGGGSIPLEAQRLGLRAFASDLNPVPVLITKALIEIPPRFAGRPPVNPESSKKLVVQASSLPKHDKKAGKMPAPQFWRGAEGLAEDVRYYGKWMRDEAEKRIGRLYPKVKITAGMAADRPDLKPYVGQELTVIAWLWARTVPSPNPALGGAHVPLVRSFWLSTKKGKEAWVEPIIERGGKDFRFVVQTGTPPATFDPGKGTVSRKGGVCWLSKGPMPFDHIRAEGKAGRMKVRLMAIVAEGERGRVYLSPIEEQVRIAERAEPTWRPDAALPDNPRDFKTPNYGMRTFADLFTPRQLVALTTFSDLVMEARERVLADARRAANCGAGFQPAHSSRAAQMVAPQGYEFIDPRSTPFVEIATRGELPHLYKEGGTYFVTFRLFDALTPAKQQPAQAGRLHHKTIDALERARQYDPPITLGACALRRPEVAGMVREALLHFACGTGFQPVSEKRETSEDGCTAIAGGTPARQSRYHLLSWCIMPNHVHVIFAPIGEHTPSDILHSWKSFTSKQANMILGRTGTFWERESFDHLIRSVEDLERFIAYLEQNPVEAGLCERPEQWPWSSCGAGFQPAREGRQDACTTNVALASPAGPRASPDRPGKGADDPLQGGSDPLPAANPSGSPADAVFPDVDAATAYADAVATYLGLAVSRSANSHCTLAIWSTGRSQSINAFGRQALPMTWDFPEVNFFAHAAGDFGLSCESMSRVIDQLHLDAKNGQHVLQADITKLPVEPESRIISTDPPYYDNIGYADLSDFFYVWLRRSLNTVHPELFRTLLTPKVEELIASPYRHEGSKDNAMSFFETGLGRAFGRMHEAQRRDYPLTVFYAFKQSETDDGDDDDDEASDGPGTASTGWETMLEGLIRAGFAITGTWPMRTERDQGLKTGDNVLASSIILVCHPRAADAAMTTRKDFVAALKKELPAALRDLQSGNIAPVDLAQAAIGPGMAIYSRHSKVVNSDGSRMPVRTALQLINQALDEVLSELESEFDSQTRWAIKWFEQHAHAEGAFGDAETLSKALAVSVRGLRDAGLVKDGQGKVRLLRRDELGQGTGNRDQGTGKDYDPVADSRPTVWEITQHLILALETDGDAGAAQLLRRAGGLGEVARDLAYRLYSTCERKKWADQARSYNGLVVAWPEIVRLSREQQAAPAGKQTELRFE